jgi:hypothetical protein
MSERPFSDPVPDGPDSPNGPYAEPPGAGAGSTPGPVAKSDGPPERPGPTGGAHPPVSAATQAELATIVLADQPLGVVLRRVAELAVKTIPGVDDASVTLIERGRPRTVAFHGQLAVTLDERQYRNGFGPCLEAAAHGQTIRVDTEDEPPDGIYADFSREARRQGIRHVLSVGMPPLQQTSGGVNIYGSGAGGAFDDTTVEAVTTFSAHAAVTLFNAAVAAGARDEVAQMKQAMASRAEIEQAKGMVMLAHRCTADEAFAIMVKVSSRSNRKLRDVARAIIQDGVSGRREET